MRMILYIIKANVLQRSRSYGEGCLTPSMCKSIAPFGKHDKGQSSNK